MKEKVLITGANGFIGCHLTTACLKQGMEVHAAVRKGSDLSTFRLLVSDIDNVQLVYPDYTSPETLAPFLKSKKYDYIIHNAGVTKAGNEKIYQQVNAELTRDLALATMQADIPLRRFVHISSLAAVGPVPYSGHRERPSPVTAYGRSKLRAEHYLAGMSDLPLTTIRPTAVYGPGERDLLILFRLLAKGWDFSIGNTPQKLTFIYVEDLANAVLQAMKCQAGDRMYFDLSDGEEYSRESLTAAFEEFAHKKCRRIIVPTGLVSALAELNELYAKISKRYPTLNRDKISELTAENWYCDIRPAREILGYTPRFNLLEGVAETIRWYRKNQWL